MKKQPNQALQALIDLRMAKDKAKGSSLLYSYVKPPKYDDSTANGLTTCIIDFLNMMDGSHAERISNEGRTIDTRKTITNVVGQVRQIGSIKRIKSSMQLGTADISATILGRSVKIEVKIGKDRQSEAQKIYQKQIEDARGYYKIVKDFEEFYNWFTDNMAKVKSKKVGQNA